jgi:hypothetical protein
VKEPKPHQVPQKPQAKPESEPAAQSSSGGTFLDRIVMPAMSGEEALRRYGSTLRQDQIRSAQPSIASGKGNSASAAQDSGTVQNTPNTPPGDDEPSARAQPSPPYDEGWDDRDDLLALAELPVLWRIVAVVVTGALVVGIVLTSLFIVGWLNGL